MTSPRNPEGESLDAGATPRFTPGPWSAEQHGPKLWQIDAAADAVATTAFCYAPESGANARLIAAPDLYEALRDAREFIANDLETSLRDACIVREDGPDRSTMDELCAPYIEDCEARLARIDAALARAEARS